MEKPNNQQDQNIIEMAKKRRHIHLLEKLQRGRSSTPTLSTKEIKELERFANNPDLSGIIDTQEKVAKFFRVDVRTIQRWVKSGMPVTSQGFYDILEIKAWRDLKTSKKGKSKEKADSDGWEQKYREYKARLAEINLKKALGELIDRKMVEKELIQVSLTIKNSFLALPRQVAPQLYGLEKRQIVIILTDRVNEIINKFANGKIFNEFSKNLKNTKI